ncbi:MAG: undecaprenyl-diphosphate phosphatase [bacterium]|nr:undecaprenyl-diphosphate phosphatase [bacterium]
MNLWQSFLLGLIQGLTEFLPVSSSGHLTLFGAFLNVSGGEGDHYRFFVVMTHFGTLLAILAYYRKDLLEMIMAVFRWIGGGFRPRAEDRPTLNLVGIIILGTIPAVLIGLTLDDLLERLFTEPLPAAIFMSVTGFILLTTRWTGNRVDRKELGVRNGVMIGLAQAFAILPGISRSGSTIAMGLAAGLKRDEAARFAFLLAIPALLGAAIFDIAKIESLAMVDWATIAVGTLTALLSGYFALVWLIRLLARDSFWKFSWYCWTASLIGILVIVFRG